LFGALPGADVPFCGAEQRVQVFITLGVAPRVFDELGQEPDVHEALRVEVERARAELRLGKGDVPRQRLERIAQRLLLGRRAARVRTEARARRAREAVEVEAEALGGVA